MSRPDLPRRRGGKDTTSKKIAKALGISYQRAMQLKTKYWTEIRAMKGANPDLPMKECAVRVVREKLPPEETAQ